MSVYHLDYETFSECPLGGPKGLGQFRYAADPSTEILIFSIARDDEPPLFWSQIHYSDGVLSLLNKAVETGSPIYAHNAPFEAAISKYLFEKTFGIRPPNLEQWRCTAAMARRAAIPNSLEMSAKFLGLDAQKDKEGERLIKKFSIPQKPTKKNGGKTRFFPKDDPEDFQRFCEYCIQDVETERALHKRLSVFELKGFELESFQFDMRMNDRGIPVNVEALQIAQGFLEEYVSDESAKFRELTGLNPTQTTKLQKWFGARGYPHKSLAAEFVQSVLEHPPEATGIEGDAYKALEMKSKLSFAANAKIDKMLKMACPDGRVRGALIWSGAERTHRWTGSGIQPQNFRRPTVKGTEFAYNLICSGNFSPEVSEFMFGPPLETVASCVRHFIQPHEGKVLDADFSAIEARINPWLCGHEKKLDDFRNRVPIYEKMGSRIFKIPVPDIGPKSIERFVGKQAELGCGYQMGSEKFKGTCENFGENISLELAKKAVDTWREDNQPIVQAWASINDAAKAAIRNPGKIFDAVPTKRIRFGMSKKGGFPALVMLLPSGHKLVYPKAKLVPTWTVYKSGKAHKFKNEYDAQAFVDKYPAHELRISPGDEIQYWGVKPQTGGKVWTWLSTYGGKLLENATQAVAGDLMANGALKSEERGFEIFMLVHDQALSHLDPKSNPEAALEEFCRCLCDLPIWAEGLPLDAEGEIVRFYKK